MKNTTPRPPIVAIMGHIDHGKSTLLDYIRKTNVVAGEAGGITQHLSAYEITIPYQKETRQITFLDTPGHAAFTGMRTRGAAACDIAILVVSAEDGVKAQTLEALHTIRAAGIPFIVAINKIDRPNANLEKTKQSLAGAEVLVEGYGGDIPFVAISAKEGTNVADLLETIILVADLENISADADGSVEGLVIESRLDVRRGIHATIIIKNGTLHKGQFLVTGTAMTTTRIMENFLGKPIDTALPGTPVSLVGFDSLPSVGIPIAVFKTKKEALAYIQEIEFAQSNYEATVMVDGDKKVIPLIIKADVYGTVEATQKEIEKMDIAGVHIKIIGKGIGAIAESDVKLAQSDKETIILGFNVALDNAARELNEKVGATVERFNIIYKLTEWLETELEKRRPRKEVREVLGTAKVLKVFSKTKERQVIGCRVEEGGKITERARVSIVRRDFPIAEGTIIEIQHAKQKVKELTEGECGMLVECKADIAPGDTLEVFTFNTV